MTALSHAPGRANLIGEHTDHTDGLVLPEDHAVLIMDAGAATTRII